MGAIYTYWSRLTLPTLIGVANQLLPTNYCQPTVANSNQLLPTLSHCRHMTTDADGRYMTHPLRRYITQRLAIIQELHDGIGHRGKQAIFEKIRQHYQWKRLYDDVVESIKTCEECQRRARNRYEEPTWMVIVWAKIGVDIVYMPSVSGGYGFTVFARDDLNGWMEGWAIDAVNSWNVAKFIYENVIYRHGCSLRIMMDEDAENLDLTKDLLDHYRIQQTLISAYHPQANGLVERGHDSIVNSLAKCNKESGNWMKFLPLAL